MALSNYFHNLPPWPQFIISQASPFHRFTPEKGGRQMQPMWPILPASFDNHQVPSLCWIKHVQEKMTLSMWIHVNGVHHLEQKTTLNAGVLQPPTAVSSVSNFPHAPLKQCVARPSKWNNKPKNSKKKEKKKQAGIINPCEKDGTSEKTLKIKHNINI